MADWYRKGAGSVRLLSSHPRITVRLQSDRQFKCQTDIGPLTVFHQTAPNSVGSLSGFSENGHQEKKQMLGDFSSELIGML